MTSDLRCPIVGFEVGPTCSRTSCMHNSDGACSHQRMVDLEGDSIAVAEYFSVSELDVQKRVRDIQCALVASSWFEYINAVGLTDGRPRDFDAAVDPLQAKEFVSWNKSQFNFGQIIVMLVHLRQSL